ncbi:hypothetical protein BKA70DRAFT_1250824 [Coprinopsis sp. MPI-PUGE-AT-0042]|nr:hypothetical protein BKA70DRAFT_1250824 [Coprinopsis sp. MPI-PUGE-AT-0042]
MATKSPVRQGEATKPRNLPRGAAAPPEGQTTAATPKQGQSRRRRRGRAKAQEPAEKGKAEVKEQEQEAPRVVETDGWGSPGAWGDDWAGEYNTNDKQWGHAAGKPPMTVEAELERKASLHFELAQQIVPFWLKGIEAAEKGEPELKLEAYWDEHIAKVKASGWFWTQSDYDRDEARRKKEKEERKARGEEEWSNNQEDAKEDLWAANGWGNGWDSAARWQSWEQDRSNGWEQVASKRPTQDVWAGDDGWAGSGKKDKWWNRQPRHGQRNRR